MSHMALLAGNID